MPRALVRPTIAVVMIALLFVNSLVQKKITAMREDPNLHYGPSFQWIENLGKIDATAVTIVVVAGVMGGLRGLAADLLWMKSDEYWHSGRADRMIPVLRTVTILDPHFLDAWRIAGWHWAYNLYVETDDPVKKEMCLRNGIKLLKEGIQWNPDKFDLYFELGWTYFDKMGDFINAPVYFEEARVKKNAPRNPDYILRMVAHAHERFPELDLALDAYARLLAEEPGKFLGNLDPALELSLNTGKVTDALRTAVRTHGGVTLHPTAYVIPIPKHNIWVILNKKPAEKYFADGGFLVRKEGTKLSLYPGDPVGIGATITIHLKYDAAWALYKKKDYPRAEAAIKDYLATDPKDVIGNHLLARIYENWALSDPPKLKKALAVWEFMAKNNSADKLAPRRVLVLRRELRKQSAT